MENFSFYMKRVFCLTCLLFVSVAVAISGDKPFVVVIDAGHGGKDPGAFGYTLKLKEKDINLKTALKLGDLLSKEKGVKVLYTRKKDIFIPLDDRAQIANKAKADLFISIHTNAAENRSARGTESYAVGSSSANLEVAKRENAVMLYESDYKTKYRGFDPNSTESYIMFDILQSKYMEQSVSFASLVEQNFTKSGRSSRGVKQAGFWVLKQAAMPAVLVELGYISNREEESFLSKDKNLDKLADDILKAFVQYKKIHDKRSSDGYKDVDLTKKESTSEPEKVTAHETAQEKVKETPVVAKTDSSSEKLPTSESVPSTLKEEKTQGAETVVPEETPRTQEPVETKKEEPKTPQIYYAVQFCSSNVHKPSNAKEFKNCVPAQEFVETGTYKFKYVFGHETTFEAAVKLRDEVKKTFKDAFLVVIRNGVKLSADEARQYYK